MVNTKNTPTLYQKTPCSGAKCTKKSAEMYQKTPPLGGFLYILGVLRAVFWYILGGFFWYLAGGVFGTFWGFLGIFRGGGLVPPPPANSPPLQSSPPHPGDHHFHVFLVYMYCAGLCCPSALRMALRCFPLTTNQAPVCVL